MFDGNPLLNKFTGDTEGRLRVRYIQPQQNDPAPSSTSCLGTSPSLRQRRQRTRRKCFSRRNCPSPPSGLKESNAHLGKTRKKPPPKTQSTNHELSNKKEYPNFGYPPEQKEQERGQERKNKRQRTCQLSHLYNYSPKNLILLKPLELILILI